MTVIGLLSNNVSGQTERVADYLSKTHQYRRMSYDALPTRILVAIYGHKFEMKNNELRHDGLSVEQLLTSIKLWGRALRPDYWSIQLDKHIDFVKQFEGSDLKFVVEKVKYKEDIEWIKSKGGKLWAIGQYSVNHKTIVDAEIPVNVLNDDVALSLFINRQLESV